MVKQIGVLVLALTFAFAHGQGGQGGQAGQGGRQAEYDQRLQAIDQAIGTYLNSEEMKSILTPGEHVEWKVDMKVGQVIVAEARSEAFDPALEIVDGAEKVLATNDDRYPGDQRPLLLWECEKDGTYLLRGRSFMNKAGGQFFTRFNLYDTMPLETGKIEERPFDKPIGSLILFKVPMQAGQIKRIMVETPSNRHMAATLRHKISPIGLPDIGLAAPLYPTTGDPAARVRGANVLMAPVAGNYYILADLWAADRGNLRASAIEIAPAKLAEGTSSIKANTDAPGVWTLDVKAGQFIQVSTPELHLESHLVVSERPDVSKYDVSKPETNPFFPRLKGQEPEPGPALVRMPGRARDPRIVLFVAQRDATLWIASNGAGPDNTQYTLSVKPAARAYAESGEQKARLQVGNTDYWAFDAKVGDVMTLTSGTSTFAERLVLRGPDLEPVWDLQAVPDQTTLSGLLIVTKPGRYLAAISSLGDGGGGDYSVSRTVFASKEFGKGKPAQGQIAEGEVQVWKFTAPANDPLLLKWKSSAWGYSISVYLEDGSLSNLPLTTVDETSRYGILKVDKPITYLIVLTGTRGGGQYTIEVNDLPGT